MSRTHRPTGLPWIDPRAVEAGQEFVGVGGVLTPEVVVAAYRDGVFPMPLRRRLMGWWSPDPRAILPVPYGMRVTKSLRASTKAYTVTIDSAFDDVVRGCANPARDGGWITGSIREVYAELHRRGIAHSVETRTPAGDLVGGLYGVELGGLFAGESMFHTARDASKVALVALVDRLSRAPGVTTAGMGRLLDTQWRTDHLATLGVIEVPRRTYLSMVPAALDLPAAFSGPVD